MTVTVNKKPTNEVELTVEVSPDELRPFLEAAAGRLSDATSIPGFRVGKAPYDMVKARVGEMKIYEEALESAVRSSFVKAVLERKIETVGSPHIDIVKLAPGNDLVFTAEVARMPSVTRMADLKALTVKKQEPEVKEADMENALKDLTRMQTKEVRAEAGTAATKADKVVINMNIKKDNVPLEGGQALDHAVFLAEAYYIPGFIERLVGAKEGENKTFKLKFPKEHYQKHLAEQEVEFEVDVKEIFHLLPPEINDEFAVALGQKDLPALKAIIKDNMAKEKEEQEAVRQERELLELLAKNSRFQDIPDLLVNEEINKMIDELKHGVEDQGQDFEDYLKSLKKTIPEVKIDFTPQALTRIKVAIVIKEVAKLEDVKVTSEEIDEELDHLAEHYGEDREAKEKIYSPAYRDYLETIMRNRKVIVLLKELMVGGTKGVEGE